jgi:membrane protease YdiL (CAAX protease family)
MSDPEILPAAEAAIPAVPAPPPVPNSIFHTLCLGPNGIRAGWRTLIFLALVVAITLALAIPVVVIYLMRSASNPSPIKAGFSTLTPLGTAINDGSLLVVAAIAALIMTRIERRKFGQYGLPLRSAFGKDFWIGTLIGFTAITGCLLGISSLHGFRVTGLAIHGSTRVSATAAWCAAFVLVGLAEEFSFRGYLQYTLTTGMGFWPSAILLSALFGLVHAANPGETKFGLVSVVLFGLLFCLFLERRGNLWWAVGFHAGWDWGQTFFYGVPDSGLAPYHNLFNSAFNGPVWLTGGSVGPEASIFTPITLVIVAVLFAFVYRENLYQAP